MSWGFSGATGELNSATVTKYATAIKGLNLEQAKLALSTKSMTDAQKEQILVEAGLLANDEKIKGNLVQKAILNSSLSQTQKERILEALKISEAETTEAVATTNCTRAQIEKFLATKGIVGADAEATLSSMGLTGANNAQSLAWKGLGLSIKEATTSLISFLFTNPVGWAIGAAGAIFIATKAYDALITSVDEARESLEEFKEVSSELENAKTELSDINDKIAEIQNKGTLGITDQAELDRLESERKILDAQVELLKLKKELAADKSNRDAVKAVQDGNREKWWSADSDNYISNLVTQISIDERMVQGYTAGLDNIDSNDTVALEKQRKKIDLYERSIAENKEKLTDLLLRDLETLEQITGDDPTSTAAREKLQDEIATLEQYVYTSEQLTKKRFDNFISDKSNKDISDAFIKLQDSGNVTAESIENLTNKFPKLKGFMDENEVSAETLAAEYAKVANEADVLSKSSTSSLTSTLTALENTSKSLKSLNTAYGELKDDGSISIGSLKSINEEFSKVEGIDGYINRLSSAKLTAREAQQIFGELTIAKIKDSIATGDLKDATEDQIAQMLEEASIANASTVAHELLAQKKAASALSSYDASEGSKENAIALINECGSAKIAAQAIAFLNTVEELYNLGTDEVAENCNRRIEKFKEVGVYANWTAEQMNKLANTTLTYSDGKWWVNHYEADNDNNGELDYLYSEEYKGFQFTAPTAPTYTGGNGKSSSSPSQKDTELDAIKQRIELEKQRIEQINSLIDLQDLRIEIADSADFETKLDALMSKYDLLKQKTTAMKDEFNRLNSITPTTADQAEALASRMKSLGDEMRSNIKEAVTLRGEIESANLEQITNALDNKESQLNRMIKRLDRDLESLTSDEIFKDPVFSMSAMLPTVSNDAVSKQKRENDELIEEQKRYQDEINEIIVTSLKMQAEENEAAQSEGKAALRSTLQETKSNVQTESAAITDSAINAADTTKTEVLNRATEVETGIKTSIDNIAKMEISPPSIDATKWDKWASEIRERWNKAFLFDGGTSSSTPTWHGEGSEGSFGSQMGAHAAIKYAGSFVGQSNVGGKFSGGRNEAWCADFATGILRAMGYGDDVVPKTASVAVLYDFFKNSGRFSDKPQKGAFALFDWNNGGNSFDHVGIVESFDENNIHTIEGNTSGGKVARRTRPRNANIIGYGLPRYESGGTADGFSVVGDNEWGLGIRRPELAVFPNGHVEIVGKNGVEIRNFPAGTQIIPYNEAKKIISQKKPIRKYASGTIKPMDIAKYIRDKYPEITDVGIAAILGNIYAESGFNPNAATYENYGSGSSKMIWRRGLFQLDDTRISNWSGIVASGDWTKQIDTALAEGRYLNSGMGSNSKYNVWNRVLTNTKLSPSEAAALFDQLFERSDGSARSKRQSMANEYYNQIVDDVINGVLDEAQTIVENVAPAIENAVPEWKKRLEEVIKEAEKPDYYDQAAAEKYLNRATAYNGDEADLKKRAAELMTLDQYSEEYWDKRNEWLADSAILTSESTEFMSSFKTEQLKLHREDIMGAYNGVLDLYAKYVEAVNRGDEAYDSARIREYIDALSDLEDKIRDNTEALNENVSATIEANRTLDTAYVKKHRNIGDGYDYGIEDNKWRYSLTDDTSYLRRAAAGNYRKILHEYNNQDEYHARAEELRESLGGNYDTEKWFDAQGEFTSAFDEEIKFIGEVNDAEAMRVRVIAERIQDMKKAYMESESIGKDAIDAQIDLETQIYEHNMSLKIARDDAKITLLQKYHDVTNSIADEQYNINKELQSSLTMYEYLDEATRKLLFNQEDYNALSAELGDISKRANSLQNEYLKAISHATEQEMPKLTAEYERQYEILMKKYEISKADLEVAKKRQQLDNVLNERNVRMLINGEWQWVANTQDVINAQNELADAERAKQQAETGMIQAMEVQTLQAHKDNLEYQKECYETELGKMYEYFDTLVTDFGENQKPIMEFLNNTVHDVASVLSLITGQSSNRVSTATADTTSVSSSGMSADFAKLHYEERLNRAILNGNEKEALALNKLRNEEISKLGTNDVKWSDDEISDRVKRGYSSGTKHALSGLSKINENNKDEILVTKYGTLIPMANLGGGEMIFSNEMTKNLWAQAQMPITEMLNNLDAVVKAPQTTKTDNNFMGDIIIHNPTSLDDLLSQLNQAIAMRAPITSQSRKL